MDREEALQELQNFKNRTGLSRDKMIDLYNSLKNSDLGMVGIVVNGELRKFNYEPFFSYINTSDIRNVYKTKGTFIDSLTDDDKTEMTKLRQDKLRANDKLRFERNAFNKRLRELSALEELNQELINGLNKLKPIVPEYFTKPCTSYTEDVLVVSIGDWHLGEISAEFKHTGFDMEIASKRLKKYADYIKGEIINKGYKKVVIMCGGDICNNVTLLCKRLQQTSNRATTTIMAVVLMEHFILDIYEACPNIVFAGVGNNESRYDEDYFEDEYLITNCADYVVYNMLELLFTDIPTIKFLGGRNCEKVVNINGSNILLTHGVTFGKGDVEKAVQQAISRYSVKNVDIRYVLLSHIHCTRNSNFFSRHGSLVGGNAYSNSTLNLQTRASQNILTVSKNGDINSLMVDLEDVDGITGYDISNEIKKFSLKSRDKREDLDLVQVA